MHAIAASKRSSVGLRSTTIAFAPLRAAVGTLFAIAALTCLSASTALAAAPIRILVLCTGNSARSQMTAGFLKSIDPNLEVHSAGTAPAPRVNPFAVRAMSEVGIDISGGVPKNVRQFLGQSFDFVVTVCDDADRNCPNFRGKVGRRVHIGFPDPARATGTDEEKMTVFRQVRDNIRARFRTFYDEEVKSARADASPLEELAKRVLTAYEKRDNTALQSLAVGRSAFEQVFWPDLRLQMPASTVADGFRQHEKTSLVHLNNRLSELGGMRFELVRISHDPIRTFAGFRQYRNVYATVQEVEHGGSYRVGSYFTL